MRSKLSIFAVIAVFLGLSAPSFAHEVGLLGGLNISMISATASIGGLSATATSGSIARFMFGATSSWTIAENMGIGGDVFYMPRGFSSGLTETTLNYITVPVTFQYAVVPEYLKLGVGPYLGFGFGDISSSTLGVSTSSARPTGMNSVDFGAVAQVAGMLPVTENINLLADIRFYLGLTDLYSLDLVSTNYRDITLMLGASYKF